MVVPANIKSGAERPGGIQVTTGICWRAMEFVGKPDKLAIKKSIIES